MTAAQALLVFYAATVVGTPVFATAYRLHRLWRRCAADHLRLQAEADQLAAQAAVYRDAHERTPGDFHASLYARHDAARAASIEHSAVLELQEIPRRLRAGYVTRARAAKETA